MRSRRVRERIRDRGRAAAREPDRGQATVEFLGMLPLILLVLVLCWQFVLVGYTFVLAGNAADKGARAAAVGGDCQDAATEDLPQAWASGAEVSCQEAEFGQLAKATVGLKVPVLFPGTVSFPMTVTGTGGAPSEAEE
ncbi:pilus assembly protein [Streptomyces sp. XM4193]|uniref:TadE/TadG family type IV pilus assembly protein n=1 Tax=Streptomyces sp. XM4193 TaxID=2929782 RepID=UPI001FF769D1|nr:TadE/TadG family type IV pilus assembly protein [Streptomyces sp. XM4193]MCK1795731.1 pilus assembly protein [Streptomyces sp. XM4193]